jgi:hypothetical protein
VSAASEESSLDQGQGTNSGNDLNSTSVYRRPMVVCQKLSVLSMVPAEARSLSRLILPLARVSAICCPPSFPPHLPL